MFRIISYIWRNILSSTIFWTAVSALGTTLIVPVTIYISFIQIDKGEEAKKTEFTYNILLKFNEQSPKFTRVILNHYPEWKDKNNNYLDYNFIKENLMLPSIRREQRTQNDLTDAIDDLLNLFEVTLYLYNKGVVDKKLIENQLKDEIVREVIFLKNYMKLAKDHPSIKASFPGIESAMREWKKENLLD